MRARELTCARAAELLALSPRHIKRLKSRYRQGSGLRWYLNGPPRDWLQGRSPLLTALGMKDDASGKILAAQFFPSETAEGYFHCKFLVGIEIGKLSAAIQNA